MNMEYCSASFMDVKAVGEPGTFSGYGAVFGNVDSQGDVIQKGAFAKSLSSWKSRGKLPKMLLQHGGGFLGGADDMTPVGQWVAMEENAKGLKVEGRLFALNTERGQYIYEGLKSGELDSLSIGFQTKAYTPSVNDEDDAVRTLTEIDLWEVSIVTFPANPKAMIDRVKMLTHEQLRELEGGLRDAGLSQREAVIASSLFKKWLQRDAGEPRSAPRDEVTPEAAEILKSLERWNDHTWSAVFRR